MGSESQALLRATTVFCRVENGEIGTEFNAKKAVAFMQHED